MFLTIQYFSFNLNQPPLLARFKGAPRKKNTLKRKFEKRTLAKITKKIQANRKHLK